MNTTKSGLPPQAVSDKQDPNRISFLDLPAEIRNKIYTEALTRPRTLRIIEQLPNPRSVSASERCRLHNTRIFTTLLASCKQIREEATPMLYGGNAFYFRSSLAMDRFLAMIGKQLVRYLKDIEVQFGDWESLPDMSLLMEADGLERAVSTTKGGVGTADEYKKVFDRIVRDRLRRSEEEKAGRR